ncbi:hypothetical protein BJN45_05690 [Azonexus hydrophilus]|uniref:Uncharacterized protein n=1 Tax=Azonexus hydrophilus TaxID=418702 RepID=A0A1R1I7I2_9RHOO|nr:hypothetical protein [Azonexus hydrophilus]OMG54702.1 hypothetical protein BJN45_05690 [Azonexus hydrophilus]
MKASNLHDAWASPDNTRLTPKQFSFRLPIHVAAKIAALCEMYPQKSRTQIIADLLTSALDELEQNLPEAIGHPLPPEEEHHERFVAEHLGEAYEPLFYLGGPRGTFRSLANKHFFELEGELGNEKPEPLFKDQYVTEQQFKK